MIVGLLMTTEHLSIRNQLTYYLSMILSTTNLCDCEMIDQNQLAQNDEGITEYLYNAIIVISYIR